VTDEERYRRRLEAQNDRLEQFTGMVSHDLRNPLNVAQGNSSEIIYELLDATKTDDGYEPLSDETLDTVVTSAKTLSNTLDRMERLIDDLLVLARQGKQSIAVRWCHWQPSLRTVGRWSTTRTRCWSLTMTLLSQSILTVSNNSLRTCFATPSNTGATT